MNNVDATNAAAPGPERYWFQRLAEGSFEIQQCRECSRHVFYPRTTCPHCGANDLSWVRPSGKGTVYSSTVVRNRPEDGGDRNICLIDLLEGPRMMGCVVEIDPRAVRIGMPVRCRVDGRGDSMILVWIVDSES